MQSIEEHSGGESAREFMEGLCARWQDTGSVGVYGKFLVKVYPVKGREDKQGG